MGLLSYDFESDSTGSPPAGWSYELGDVTNWTVEDISGDNGFKSATDKAYSYWYCSDAGSLSDVIFQGKFLIGSDVTKSQAGVFLRQSGSSGRSCYLIAFSGQFGLAIYEFDAGSYIRTIDFNSTIYAANTYYNFKVEATGTTIRGKAWAVGAGEPGWQASGTDSTHTVGHVGVASAPYNSSDNGGVIFDDLVITSDNIGNAGLGSLAVAGNNATIGASFPTEITAGVGAVTVAGANPRLAGTASTGSVVILGYDATISADQPQQARLLFKFKDADGVVKKYEIGRRPSVQSITDSDFASVNDDIVLCDASTGALNLKLPQATDREGYIYRIKKTDSSVNAVTILRAGAATIDGANSVVLSSQHEVLTIVSDGSNWWVI